MAPFTSQELRTGFASFATGVTVITCLDADGQAHGITISSFNTVSLEPPLILWSLNKHSRLMPHFEVGHKQLIQVHPVMHRRLELASYAPDEPGPLRRIQPGWRRPN